MTGSAREEGERSVDRAAEEGEVDQGLAPDGRSRKAVAYQWASRVISVSLEMVLPGLFGYWVDQKLGTRVVFTILGFGTGLVLGMVHLVQMTKPKESR